MLTSERQLKARRWAARLGKRWQPVAALTDKPFTWPGWMGGPMLRTMVRLNWLRCLPDGALQLTPDGRALRDAIAGRTEINRSFKWADHTPRHT